jgi:hypothetical protein
MKTIILLTFTMFLISCCPDAGPVYKPVVPVSKDIYLAERGIIEIQVNEADVTGIIWHSGFYIDVGCYEWPCGGFNVRRTRQAGNKSIYSVSGIIDVYFDPRANNKIDADNPDHWYLYYQDSWWMWDVTALKIDWGKYISSSLEHYDEDNLQEYGIGAAKEL